jgi:flagellin-like hook-associated protein FlgL
MANGIILSAGVRQNLLSLQNTAGLAALTQNRLATGKKVNSALDNPTSFFTSSSLQDRAGDLNTLLDAIGQAQQTLAAADQGLTSLTQLVQSAKSIATQALQATKGTVNYTNITGSVTLAADTTQITSTAASVATAGVVSVQATATLDVSALVAAGAAADGQTLSLSFNGVNKTYTFDHTGTNGTTTFDTLAHLRTLVIADFQTAGQVATVGAVSGTAFTVTGNDVLNDFTIGGTATTGTGTQVTGTSAAAHTTGDVLTLSDGTTTANFYRVAANANTAAGTFSSVANLKTAIDATNLVGGGGHIVTTAVGATGLTLARADGGDVTISGALGVADGYISSAAGQTFNKNYNSTLVGHSGTVTVQVGANAAQTLTFGTGNGQISTKTGLNTALAALTGVTGSVTSAGKFNLAPTSSDDITVGGTAGVLTTLGVSAGTTTPTATVVTASSTRTSLQTDFNNLLTQIDQLATDSSYNGVNLLSGDNLKVVFNGDGTSSLSITGVKFDSTGLGLSSISGTGFQDDHNINSTLTTVSSALATLRTQSSKFGSTLTTVQTRQDFTKNLITTLRTGADNLVLADTNEEGANLLALQTRQQLSTTALSLANQASQAVLRLFG